MMEGVVGIVDYTAPNPDKPEPGSRFECVS